MPLCVRRQESNDMAYPDELLQPSSTQLDSLTNTALGEVLTELQRASKLYPNWPTDPVHAAAIVGEEAGELLQAALDHTYADLNHLGPNTDKRLKTESVQTCAMALRFLVGSLGLVLDEVVTMVCAFQTWTVHYEGNDKLYHASHVYKEVGLLVACMLEEPSDLTVASGLAASSAALALQFLIALGT